MAAGKGEGGSAEIKGVRKSQQGFISEVAYQLLINIQFTVNAVHHRSRLSADLLLAGPLLTSEYTCTHMALHTDTGQCNAHTWCACTAHTRYCTASPGDCIAEVIHRCLCSRRATGKCAGARCGGCAPLTNVRSSPCGMHESTAGRWLGLG